MARRKLWTCSKLPQSHRGLGQSAVGSPRHRHYHRGTAMTAMVPYKDRSSTSITAVPPQHNRRAIAKQSKLASLRRSRGVSTADMAVLPRCYHLTGPAVLPPTPQSSRKLSPWHRHQTAVVTPWDRHVRIDNAVVPPHREEEKCVTGSGKLWKTTGGVTTVMAVWTKNRSGTGPPVWRGYYIVASSLLFLDQSIYQLKSMRNA